MKLSTANHLNLFVALAQLTFVAVAPGCQRQPPRVAVYPVRGKLLVDGKPAEQAAVYFHPQQAIAGANPIPFGIVHPDGTFQPTTYASSDGLPEGKYAVTVVWPQMIDMDGLPTPGEDQLRGKYADPNRPIATAIIQPRPNELPELRLTR